MKTFNVQPKNMYDADAWGAYYAQNPGLARSIGADGVDGAAPAAGDGGSGGSADADITQTQAFKDAVTAAADASSQGLKTKNTELLNKLSQANSKLDDFGGLDADAVKNMMSQLNQSEEAKLIAEGKLDEVLTKRMDRINAEHSDSLNSLQSKYDDANERATGFQKVLKQNTINDTIRAECIKQGVLPEAFDDVARRAIDIFDVDNSGQMEARDASGQLLKDGEDRLVNPERFVQALKKSAPYYWPNSQGAGAEGGGQRSTEKDGMENLSSMASNGNFNMDEYRKQRAKMSGDGYQNRSAY